MIKTLDDVLKFYAEREEEFALFGTAVLKYRVGPLDGLEDTIVELGLPDSYARCADVARMEGVSLGYFDLCPGSTVNLCHSLLVLNGEARNPSLPDDLLNVAAFDADIIAVHKGEPHHASGVVYYVDVTTSPTPEVSPIANNYLDFLILASALDQAVLDGHDDPETIIAQVASRLAYKNYVKKWQLIASMAV